LVPIGLLEPARRHEARGRTEHIRPPLLPRRLRAKTRWMTRPMKITRSVKRTTSWARIPLIHRHGG